MGFEPHHKQQIRFQVEAGMEEVFRLERKGLDLVQSYLTNGISRQYQYFNRFKSKRRLRRDKRKKVMTHWQELVDKGLNDLDGVLPTNVSSGISTLRKLMDMPLKGAETIDGKLDEVLMKRLNKRLNGNRELVNRLMRWAASELETHQKLMNERINTELAGKLPVSEDEHFALAKDITHMVKRLENMKDDEYIE